jgi:hypothetical protein
MAQRDTLALPPYNGAKRCHFRLGYGTWTLLSNVKYCGHLKIKQGDWFTVVHRSKCEGYNRETPMTYSNKIALFDKHAHLIAIQAEFEPRRIAPAKSALALQRPHPEGPAEDRRSREKSDRVSWDRCPKKKPPRLVACHTFELATQIRQAKAKDRRRQINSPGMCDPLL